jgi:hypothetical protein
MAFKTPQYEYEQVKQAVRQQYAPEQCDEIYTTLEPFIAGGARVPLCILQLAQGRIADVKHYAECARKDYRDVIFWAESPGEAALDTPEKIEGFQRMLKWAGQEREPALDQEKERLLASGEKQKQNRPWWKVW